MSVVSPERYWQELVDIHNPGVLEVFLGTDEHCYTVRVVRSPVAGQQEGIFYWMMATLGLIVPPSLLYITRRRQLDGLQQVKVTKGNVGVHCLDASCQLVLCNKVCNIHCKLLC